MVIGSGPSEMLPALPANQQTMNVHMKACLTCICGGMQKSQDAVRIPAAFPGQHSEDVFHTIKAEVFDPSRTEMADIDSRLHALQNFLRAAKSGASGQKLIKA